MARKTEAYLDTSALIAFLDRSDSYHPLFARLFSSPPPLVTSSLVVAEGHGWFLRRYDARRAVQLLAFIGELPNLNVIPFDSIAITRATAIVQRYHDQKLTLADAHGLAIMTQRRNTACWSTDRHLSLSGVSLAV